MAAQISFSELSSQNQSAKVMLTCPDDSRVVNNKCEAPGACDFVDLVVDRCDGEVVVDRVLVLCPQRQVELVRRQELSRTSQTPKASKQYTCTNRGEGVHGIPVAVPVVHDHRCRRDVRCAECLSDVRGEAVEARGAIGSGDVQMLLFARDLRTISASTARLGSASNSRSPCG